MNRIQLPWEHLGEKVEERSSKAFSASFGGSEVHEKILKILAT